MKPYDPTAAPPKSDVIRADIEHTRQSMDHTLDEIGDRMKPRHLFDEVLSFLHLKQGNAEHLKEQAASALHSAGETAGRAAQAVASVVRQHPIPTLLIGAGVVWAIYEATHRSHNGQGQRRTADDYDDAWENADFDAQGSAQENQDEPAPAHEFSENVAEGFEAATQKVKETVATAGQQLHEQGRKIRRQASQTARAVGRKASHLKEQVAHTAQKGYEVGRAKFVETSQAHPLSVGVGFLAAGVLVGLSVPASHKEDEWLGEAADRVKDRAKAKGEDLVKRGRNVATAAVEAVKQSATEEGLTLPELKEKAQKVAAEAEQAAQRSAQQQGLTPAAEQTQPSPNPTPPY